MKKLLSVINGKKFDNPPVWFMRQAGRYLPEYRKIRSKKDNFLDLCYDAKTSSEITLQPINRFNLDAAIIFSDILVIPDALGIKVDFIKNKGPVLDKIDKDSKLLKLKINNIKNHLSPVFENISLTKSKLDNNTSLIGFSGSPWTLATYIVEGGSSKNFNLVRRSSIENEDFFQKLIDILINSIIEYIGYQIDSGVDVIKLFDSWAGILPESCYDKWVIKPNKIIIDAIKNKYPNTPIIFFAKGSSLFYEKIAKYLNVDVIAIDQNIPRIWVKNNIQKKYNKIVQGNLDNILLSSSSIGSRLEDEVLSIINELGDYPFIFNLGHGVLPETPLENIERILNIIRK